jgi:glycosyltransferase involved in cell wall biosynthesis
MGTFTRLAAGWAYRGARHVLAQTDEMKSDIVAMFGVDPARIRVLHNPVDTELIDSKLLGATSPYDSTRINVIAAGRLSREKGVDILIRSFGAVVARNPRFLLHVIGRDGGEGETLKALVSDMGLREHVVFWGEQRNPYPFLKFADLFVLPSRYEGLPNAVLECIHLRKPIVATRVVPILERLIEDGKSGTLVPVEDEARLSEAILRYDTLTGIHRPLPKQDVVAFFRDLITERSH